MQAKLKRANLNAKDRAFNMRGVLEDKKTVRSIGGLNKGAYISKDLSKSNSVRKSVTGIVKKDAEDKYIPDEEEQIKSEAKEFKEISEELLKSIKNYKFKTLFENSRVMVIDKPASIMVHPDGRSSEVSVSDIVYYNYGDMRYVGEIDKPGIVHRLDRNTTGCLVLAKTQDAFKDMKVLFREHKVKKVYRAIVEGNVRDDMGLIDMPIARARSDFRKRSVVDMYSKDFRGEKREAITRYKVIKRSADKKLTYVELYPVTGRTHQLRVHMRSIRHPIIGDDLYGSKGGSELAPRSMLHAYKIEFTLRKELISVTSPIPEDMQKSLAEFFN